MAGIGEDVVQTGTYTYEISRKNFGGIFKWFFCPFLSMSIVTILKKCKALIKDTCTRMFTVFERGNISSNSQVLINYSLSFDYFVLVKKNESDTYADMKRWP